MKNQYFGDVGDFGKYGLLSKFLGNGLRLGINWYLTEDDERNDGKFIEYFNKPEFKICDEELHDFLNRCVLDNKRNVKELNHFKRFQSIPIYDTLLKIDDIKALSPEGRNQREKFRDDWFNRSLEKFSNCDVIFCDPDNGIETKSLSKTSKDSVKYIFSNEIIGMINRGYTLIIFNHRDRSKESDYKQRFKEIYQEINGKAKLRVLRFSRYNVRDYLFFIQKKHKNIIDTQINHFLSDRNWNKLFSEYML